MEWLKTLFVVLQVVSALAIIGLVLIQKVRALIWALHLAQAPQAVYLEQPVPQTSFRVPRLFLQ